MSEKHRFKNKKNISIKFEFEILKKTKKSEKNMKLHFLFCEHFQSFKKRGKYIIKCKKWEFFSNFFKLKKQTRMKCFLFLKKNEFFSLLNFQFFSVE